MSHSIIVGNGAGKFTISTSTGAITLTGTVDPGAVAFYALTVEASDDEGETSTALVGVAVLLDECSNGTVVPRPRSNPRLVRDCSMLLASRDTLAGDASLDWSADTDISDWQGVRVERGQFSLRPRVAPQRHGPDGEHTGGAGRSRGPAQVDLDYNSLTGVLPRELGSLYDMEFDVPEPQQPDRGNTTRAGSAQEPEFPVPHQQQPDGRHTTRAWQPE